MAMNQASRKHGARRSRKRRMAEVSLSLGAIGVVFGDIGTSPLYTLKTAFTLNGGAMSANTETVFGLISLVFWAVIIVVSIKYVGFVMRADNGGEGGVMALAAFVRKATHDRAVLLPIALLLGVVGAGLFYGDSVITPAISVLSAVEGLEAFSPQIEHTVLPIALTVLLALFAAQRLGTRAIGRLSGPVMVIWFVTIAAIGVPHIFASPEILQALLPTNIGVFVWHQPGLAFAALGAVVLAITGAEALYADMGHFGASPIRRAWFALVFPCLTLNYLGQGALVLSDRAASADPFFLLVPSTLRVPMVVLATAATVIASQSVISGTYSISQQAMRLGFLPNLTVRYTSDRQRGQVYMPAINWLLCAGVVALIIGFPSSKLLANAYGLAVTGTFIVTTCLLLIVAHAVWEWPVWKLAVFGTLFLLVEGLFIARNITKIRDGAWVPVLIAVAIVVVMRVWQKGRRVVISRRSRTEGSLKTFIELLPTRHLVRVPGTAVYPHPTRRTTPIALKENVELNGILHERVIIVAVKVAHIPYVAAANRGQVTALGEPELGIYFVTLRFGFKEDQDIPQALAALNHESPPLFSENPRVAYVLSRFTLERGPAKNMGRWQKRLFIGLAHNAADPAARFRLPASKTMVMGSFLQL